MEDLGNRAGTREIQRELSERVGVWREGIESPITRCHAGVIAPIGYDCGAGGPIGFQAV